MGETVSEPVELTPEEVEFVEEALRSAKSGRTVPFEQVLTWVESWASDNELPMPEAGG